MNAIVFINVFAIFLFYVRLEQIKLLISVICLPVQSDGKYWIWNSLKCIGFWCEFDGITNDLCTYCNEIQWNYDWNYDWINLIKDKIKNKSKITLLSLPNAMCQCMFPWITWHFHVESNITVQLLAKSNSNCVDCNCQMCKWKHHHAIVLCHFW